MIEWLYDLQLFGVKLGLDPIRGLLRVLGHPEREYRSVLVGGTNGKGSVAAMVHSMLEAGGVKAGLFTSPHLVRPHERIRIGDADIEDAALDRLLRSTRDRIEASLANGDLEVHPSFFEVVTATALQAFRERRVQTAVLEVGLGGRLDATNAVGADVAVVVSVDLDHTKTLGPTLEHIATEKAGIIKPGKPLISGVAHRGAISILERTCRERGSELIDARLAVRLVSESSASFTLETKRHRYPGLRLALAGRHQIDNARIALAVYETLADRAGFEPDPAAVSQALATVRWPGRLQWIRRGDDAPDLLMDGAHNPAGARALGDYLRQQGGPAPIALFGAMHGKLLPEMLDQMASVVESMVVTRPDVKRAADPEEIAALARERIPDVEVVADPAEAFRRAVEKAGSERFVLVTGSLYLVGEVLALLEPRPTPGPVSM